MTSFVTAKYDALSGQILDPNSVITSPYTLKQSAVPSILPSSGTSNATGQITLTTALPYTPTGVVFLYLPAGVVTAGAQGTGAGLYQVVFSSTTVCQIQGTGIVTANAAYTQTTGADINLATVIVPGGIMGANGWLRITRDTTILNSATSKTGKILLGGQTVGVWGATTVQVAPEQRRVKNRNSQAVQHVQPDGFGYSNVTTASFQTTVDTSVAQTMLFQGQLAAATDYIIQEGYTVEVLPSA